MPKFLVYVTATVSRCVGEVEAKNKKEARKKAEEFEMPNPSLCWQCSEEWDIGDVDEILIDEIK